VLAAVPPELRAKPVLNDYGFGGYLIWSGVRPFIDGRADTYGGPCSGSTASLRPGSRDPRGDFARLPDRLDDLRPGRWGHSKPQP
jgi:hypothetical protein